MKFKVGDIVCYNIKGPTIIYKYNALGEIVSCNSDSCIIRWVEHPFKENNTTDNCIGLTEGFWNYAFDKVPIKDIPIKHLKDALPILDI